MPAQRKINFPDLDRFSGEIKHELMRRVTHIVYERVREAAPVGRTRNLRDSIEERVGSGGGYGVVKAKAYHAHLVIRGTKAHVIRPKERGGALTVGQDLTRVVEHPGSKANDFMAKGLAAAGGAVAQAVAEGDIMVKVKGI